MDEVRRPFQGVISEIPQISVDYFKGFQSATAFFLSHCHADHMVGMKDLEFHRHLQAKGYKVYCSKVTKALISKWEEPEAYCRLLPCMEACEVNQTYHVDLPCTDGPGVGSFSVTLIPAGHCPGSVMFLFEGRFGTVLYTGDFRFAKGDVKQLRALWENTYDIKYGFKSIDHVYLDCTFCAVHAVTIPAREKATRDAITLIQEWINKSRDHKVFLSVVGKGFGSEFILTEIYKATRMPIHVSAKKYEMYQLIPEILSVVTNNSNDTQIHACEFSGGQHVLASKVSLKCTPQPHYVRSFRLTTQWHMMDGSNEEKNTYVLDQEVYRVLYSMHSSLEEIQDVVECLKPGKITPISKVDKITYQEISKLLGHEVVMPVLRYEPVEATPTVTRFRNKPRAATKRKAEETKLSF